MAPLDEHDRELLDGYKAAISPSTDEVQSNWEVIADLVEREHEGRGARGWLPWVGVAAAAVALVSYVELRTTTVRSDSSEALPVQSFDRAADDEPASEVADPPGAPAQRRDVRTTPAVEEVSEPEPAAAPPPAKPSAPMPRRRPTKSTAPKPSKARGSMLDVRAELHLLERARAALAAEDFDGVLSLVRRHQREHPTGAMREELDMLRVVALCSAGPKERWRSARARFERDFPGSPLLAHLRDDCFP